MTISQASGRQIVSSGGFIGPVTCDGVAHAFQSTAIPPAGSAPFHGGSAIASGNLIVDYIDASGNFIEAGASVGPQTISIKG